MADHFLILVRHSLPEMRPAVPTSRWNLSPAGQECCIPLARKLEKYSPRNVATSVEPKAVQTGSIVARFLGIPVASAPGLQEHERGRMGSGTRAEFEGLLATFFGQPARLVFGRETAVTTLVRFSKGLHSVLDTNPLGNVVVVAHGTVIALWASCWVSADPFAFWKRLGMPALVVFSRPEMSLVEFVENVE
jgi:broad specificity phosphatase PhoE